MLFTKQPEEGISIASTLIRLWLKKCWVTEFLNQPPSNVKLEAQQKCTHQKTPTSVSSSSANQYQTLWYSSGAGIQWPCSNGLTETICISFQDAIRFQVMSTCSAHSLHLFFLSLTLSLRLSRCAPVLSLNVSVSKLWVKNTCCNPFLSVWLMSLNNSTWIWEGASPPQTINKSVIPLEIYSPHETPQLTVSHMQINECMFQNTFYL